MLNEVNRKLLMTLGVAEVFPWKWELTERMVWFGARPSDDPERWEIIHNNLFLVSITRVYEGVYKEDRFRVVRAYRELLNGKVKEIVIELRFWTKKGEGLILEWLEIHAIPGKYDGSRRLLTVEGSLMSISKRKTLEEELTAAKERTEEASRLKSTLVINMNHGIRTPLNAIIGFASLLSIVDDEKEQQGYIDLVQSNTEHLLRPMGDMIGLSSIESGMMDVAGSDVLLDPSMEEIEQIYRPKAESRNLVLAWDGEQLEAHIYTDRGRLVQTLGHLLCSAIRFMSKGTARLGYRKKEEDRIWFHATDTGCGIPEKKKELILERFVKLNDLMQGLGLGSPLCKIIVDRLYGTIGVDSKMEEGSTFWLIPPDLSGKPI